RTPFCKSGVVKVIRNCLCIGNSINQFVVLDIIKNFVTNVVENSLTVSYHPSNILVLYGINQTRAQCEDSSEQDGCKNDGNDSDDISAFAGLKVPSGQFLNNGSIIVA